MARSYPAFTPLFWCPDCPESLSGLNRNGCPDCAGIGVRFGPEHAVEALGEEIEDLYLDRMSPAVSAGLAKDAKAVEKEMAAYLPK